MAAAPRFDDARLHAAMDQAGLDAVVAVSLENVYYTTGAFIITQRLLPERLAFNIIPRNGDPTVVVCKIEESLVVRDSPIKDVRTYIEFAHDPADQLADALRDKGLANSNVGIEKRYLSASSYETLTGRLPQAEFTSCDRLFERLRAVKTPAEIEILQQAARATERAIQTAWAATRVGDSEKTVADRESTALLGEGADRTVFCMLAAGTNTLVAHHTAGDKRLQQGEIMRTDFAGSFGAYYADVARTVAIGKPNQRQSDIYRTLWEVQRETISRMRPGITAGELYEHCRVRAEKAGLEFNLPHIGHGVGIGLHEYPMLEPRNDAVLEAGMVFYVEPMVIDRATGAFHIEDLVVVTDSGPKILTDVMDTERLVSIDSFG
ncbi:MAG: Xaa-Pro peptidase family protein [Chloroflexota bacterium]